MRTTEQIAEQLAATIRHVYSHPSLYARPDNIESTLRNFHWAWAIVHETEQQFRHIHLARLREVDAASGFFSRYKHEHPNAPDEEAQNFAFHHWRAISLAMSVPLESASS